MLALRFVTLDAVAIAAILSDPAGFEREQGVVFAPHTDTILEHLTMTAKLFSQNAADVPWVSYLAVRAADGVAVGSCAFKSPPLADGTVEIAYGSYPQFERQGVATAMAAELVRIARANGAKTAMAHTLPDNVASHRVLMKNGLRHVGEEVDPEDGLVWRWELDLG